MKIMNFGRFGRVEKRNVSCGARRKVYHTGNDNSGMNINRAMIEKKPELKPGTGFLKIDGKSEGWYRICPVESIEKGDPNQDDEENDRHD